MVDVVLNKVTHFIMKSTYPYLEVQNYSTTPHKLQPAGWDQDEKGGRERGWGGEGGVAVA